MEHLMGAYMPITLAAGLTLFMTKVCITRYAIGSSAKYSASTVVVADAKPPSNETPIEITPLPDFDVAKTKPQPYRPWKSGKFVMTMGLSKLNPEDWLQLDDKYFEEQALRKKLLDEHRNGVMQILPGSEAACIEVLEMIIDYLTRRFPNLFYRPEGKENYIYNSLTGRTFKTSAPYEEPPLEIAAQLVMEDLNILIQGFGEDPEQHYLAASYSMGPAGWYLEERIGWPLWKIHSPVPLWQEKLKKSVEKYFLRMKPDEIVTRQNFFMQTNDTMFQQEPFASSLEAPPAIEDIRIRHERQSLRRLPKTGAILFAVRTFLTRVVDLEDEPNSIRELLGAVRALPPDVAKYKGRPVWGEVVEEWCKTKLGSDAEGV